MKVLNEKIARQANKKMTAVVISGYFLQCLSTFFAGLFLMKRRREAGGRGVEKRIQVVRKAVMYNEIALTPNSLIHSQDHSDQSEDLQPKSLMPFAGNLIQLMLKGLIFNLIDYIELVDWTGRLIREDKRGAISAIAPRIPQRLDISSTHWLELTTKFEKRFKGIAGTAHR